MKTVLVDFVRQSDLLEVEAERSGPGPVGALDAERFRCMFVTHGSTKKNTKAPTGFQSLSGPPAFVPGHWAEPVLWIPPLTVDFI